MTLDTTEMVNRVRFMLWFVKVVAAMPMPPDLKMMSPMQALRLFGLSEARRKTLSPEVTHIRDWLLTRIAENSPDRREARMARAEINRLNETGV